MQCVVQTNRRRDVDVDEGYPLETESKMAATLRMTGSVGRGWVSLKLLREEYVQRGYCRDAIWQGYSNIVSKARIYRGGKLWCFGGLL